jgi:amidophosphoribosyltransferase
MILGIDITPAHLVIVQNVLRALAPAGTHVWVFGSRARGEARPASDLDLAIDAGRALEISENSALAEAFDEATLPYRVDLVDLHTVSDMFKAIIERDRLPFPGFAK